MAVFAGGRVTGSLVVRHSRRIKIAGQVTALTHVRRAEVGAVEVAASAADEVVAPHQREIRMRVSRRNKADLGVAAIARRQLGAMKRIKDGRGIACVTLVAINRRTLVGADTVAAAAWCGAVHAAQDEPGLHVVEMRRPPICLAMAIAAERAEAVAMTVVVPMAGLARLAETGQLAHRGVATLAGYRSVNAGELEGAGIVRRGADVSKLRRPVAALASRSETAVVFVTVAFGAGLAHDREEQIKLVRLQIARPTQLGRPTGGRWAMAEAACHVAVHAGALEFGMGLVIELRGLLFRRVALVALGAELVFVRTVLEVTVGALELAGFSFSIRVALLARHLFVQPLELED